jgi:hypothetical protein
LFIIDAARRPAYDWPSVGKYLFDRRISQAAFNTLQLTIYSMVIAVVRSYALHVDPPVLMDASGAIRQAGPSVWSQPARFWTGRCASVTCCPDKLTGTKARRILKGKPGGKEAPCSTSNTTESSPTSPPSPP